METEGYVAQVETAPRNGRASRGVSAAAPSPEAAVTSILVRALADRSLVWFVLLAATALTGYAVVASPAWWKLVGVGGYAVLIVLPVLRLAWSK